MSEPTTNVEDSNLGLDPSSVPQYSFLGDLLDLTKPGLSRLVLVTAAGGVWLADASMNVWRAIGTVVLTAMVVGGANALNNYLERDTDRLMERTRNRPLPAGRLDPRYALAMGGALAFIAVPGLVYIANPLSALLAAVAFVLYVLVYTPMKRKSSLNTLVGAIPGAMPPLIGWTAATGTIDFAGMLLFGLLFLWQIPHSLAITLFRKEDYANAGLIVYPVEFGDQATRHQILLFCLPLIVLPWLLIQQDVGGVLTMSVGTLLGVVFAWKAWQGVRKQLDAVWARKLFLFSLVYLLAFFVVLTVDQLITI